MQHETAAASGIDSDHSVAVASTGVIGVPLPMDAVLSGIAMAGQTLGPAALLLIIWLVMAGRRLSS